MLLSVARVSKLFGVEGGVLLNLYTTFPDDFSTEEPLFVKIDSLAEPPMFKISETHSAATWLLDPRAPKVEMPVELQKRIARMLKEAKADVS